MSDNFYPKYNLRSKGMEKAAFALAIISILTCSFLYSGLICGSLAVILALLSKGGARSMSSKAMLAMILGFAGIGATVALYTVTFLTLLHTYGSLEGIMEALSSQYGLNYQSLIN